VIIKKETKPRAVKYRTIRVREEVAKQLDEWRDLFEDASMSEVMWRIFSLARRELKRVRDKKRKVRERFVTDRKQSESLDDLGRDIVDDLEYNDE
jgi:glutamyl-tRNA reductase